MERRRLALRSAPSERAACATDPVTLRRGIRRVFGAGSAYLRLFEPKRQPSAQQTRIADVRATEHRLEVVEKQFVRQVLNIELQIHRDAILLHEVGADRLVENRSRTNAAALEVDFVEQPRVKTLRHEIGERRRRMDIDWRRS